MSRPSSLDRRRQVRGLTLVELLVATAITAVLMSGLTSVTQWGLNSRAQMADTNERLAQVTFAMRRLVIAAKSTVPHSLLPPAANTSGDWFSAAYFCVNASRALIETTSADTTCTGTHAIADGVSSFSVVVPATSGPLEPATVQITVTTTSPNGNTSATLTETVRLGGAIQ